MNRQTLKETFALILAEIRAAMTSRLYLLILLVIPLVLSLFLGHIMVKTRVPQNLPLVLLDQDGSQVSREIARYLDTIPGTAVAFRARDIEAGRRILFSGRARGFVVIPRGFSKAINRGEQARITVYEDFNFLLPGRTIAKNMALLEGWLQNKYFKRFFQRKGVSGYSADFLSRLGLVEYHKLFNPNLEYTQFLLPGLLITVIYQVICVLSGMILFTNRSIYTGISKIRFLFSKLTAHTLLSLLPFLIISGILFPLFSLRTGNFWDALGLFIPFSLGTFMMGMLISVIVKEPVFTTEIMIVIGAIGFTISGVTWPMSMFPGIVKFVAHLLPLTPYLDNCMKSWYATGAPLQAWQIWIYVPVLFIPVMMMLKRVFNEK